MRIFGHPIHPMLVHFPIAFWPSGSVVDVLFWLEWVPNPYIGVWLICAGLSFGVLAVITGFIDLVKLDEKYVPKANKHAILMCTSWILFLGSILVRIKDGNLLQVLPGSSLALNFIACVTLIAGGWFGGELVHKDGVTNIKPQSNGS